MDCFYEPRGWTAEYAEYAECWMESEETGVRVPGIRIDFDSAHSAFSGVRIAFALTDLPCLKYFP